MDYSRPLERHSLAISVSETEDSKDRGFPRWQVNHLTLQIVSALFGQGAGAIFGHDWRDDGVMEAVYGFAQRVRSPIASESANTHPLLQNLLPWPDRPTLQASDLERLSSVLLVKTLEPPAELVQFLASHPKEQPSDVSNYVRARALTNMRRRLVSECTAMLCIGGRHSGFQGRYAGIAEEAYFAIQERRPLYVSGILGGVSAEIINAFRGREVEEFHVNDLYRAPPVREVERQTEADRIADGAALRHEFRTAGVNQLISTNGLARDENEELFDTTVADRVIQLVLKGLSNIK